MNKFLFGNKVHVIFLLTSRLRTYSEEIIGIAGRTNVTVEYGEQKRELSLLVVKADGPTLLGRDWLQEIRFDWNNLFLVTNENTKLNGVLQKHKGVFRRTWEVGWV